MKRIRASLVGCAALVFATSATAAAQAAIQSCLTSSDLIRETPAYMEATPSFQVDMMGNVLIRPDQPVDESDVVTIYVNTTPDLAKKLRVRRASAFRPVGLGNVAGEGLSEVTATAIASAAVDPHCLFRIALTDFAPGRGEVLITTVETDSGTNTNREVATGTFDFRVNPVYIGAFSMGPVRTTVASPTFGIAPLGADSIVTASDQGRRMLYGLFYTPFVWGRRDLEKIEPNLHKHLNPLFGVALNDVSENAFFGLTLDLPPGIFVHYGLHVARATAIDPNAGLAVGDRVSGITAVPTTTEWTAKPFTGITLDLRVALKFFKSVTSTSIPR